MVRGPLRSYISSTSKFDFHVEEDGEKVKEISDFLIKAGKARLSPLERKEGPSSSNQTITIGLRQTLKELYKKKLKWILLDSDAISPSAVSHVFGLLATSNTSDVSFYVFKGLSSTLSKDLKLPRISAVGFGADCQLSSFFDRCTPVELFTKQKPTKISSNFVVPELHQPAGKSKNPKKKKKNPNFKRP